MAAGVSALVTWNRAQHRPPAVLIVACVNIPASGRAGLQTGASIYPSVQNLMLAARALGLGTVLTTLHRRRKARIHAILGIPDHIESAAIIPLGWPDREYGPNRCRRTPTLLWTAISRDHGTLTMHTRGCCPRETFSIRRVSPVTMR